MKYLLPILIVIATIIVPSKSVEARTVAKESINGYTISVSQHRGKTICKWNGKRIHSYRFHGKVKVVPERKLTEKMLLRRKGKMLYIERIVGKVINNRLDGRTSEGYYISYKSLCGKVVKGDVIVTYCIYNPFTRWIDDIDERYDIIL